MLEALLEDFDARGPEAIARCRKEDPASYVRIMAGLLPKDGKVTHSTEGMSVEEIDAEIRRILAEAAARDGDGRLIDAKPIEQDEE